MTITAATTTMAEGRPPEISGPTTASSNGTEATAMPITAGSACASPCTTAMLNNTRPLPATPASHSHSTPRGPRIGRLASRQNTNSNTAASA
ncbi:MAG TPA: hypothetical protein VHX38_28925 [Pseudonocardiaceae bacterium]|nr:hypothetical protein [Pseudonocardiaceae bacterium]